MKITVIAGNGMGGTEKAAYLFAAELARRGHEVHALTNNENHRLDELARAGVKIRDIQYDRDQLIQVIQDIRPDVIHQHTSGYGDHRELYEALDTMGRARPKLIETNVFGRLLDRYDHGLVDMRMFVSMASGCQAFRRPMIRKTTPSIQCHTVLYNPLPCQDGETFEPENGFRDSYGISHSDFVFVRVGRPGHKWTTWECESFQKARNKAPDIKLVLMEPTQEIQDAIHDGLYGDGIVIIKATSDQEFLSQLYRNADAMLHASRFGESYGYTLAEGMRFGLPIITRTTPWADNAQVELVNHGVNGYVCCSIKGMERAIIDCATSPDTRKTMSESACNHVQTLSDLCSETDLLEEVLVHVTSGFCGPLLQERFSSWMAYGNDVFPRAEWRVYENEIGMKSEILKAKSFAMWKESSRSIWRSLHKLKSAFKL